MRAGNNLCNPLDESITAIALLGIALRVSMAAILAGHVETQPDVAQSSLLASELVEGWELWRRGLSPYMANACRCPALLLLFGGVFRRRWLATVAANCGDALTAYLLHILAAEQGRGVSRAAQFYWLNPMCAWSCAIGSLQPWVTAAVLSASQAAVIAPLRAGVLLAASVYADIACAAPALTLIAVPLPRRVMLLLGLSIGATAFALATRAIVRNESVFWLSSLHIEPSLGVSWYALMVVFDRFVPYFKVVFQGHAFIYALPLAWRLPEMPALAAHTSFAIGNVFKCHPTFSDAALNASLALAHFSRGAPSRTSRAAIIGTVLVAGLPLATRRVASDLWLGPGTANSNHVYFQTAIFSAASSLLLCFGIEAAVANRRSVRHGKTKLE